MKKVIALLLVAVIAASAFPVSASASKAKPSIAVWIGNEPLSFDVPPVMVDGTTYVEFRSLFEAFGYKLAYDSKAHTMTGTSVFGSMTLNTITGKATVNGKPIAGTIRLITKEGRTLVPLKFIAAVTGAKVEWNAASQTVRITTSRIGAVQEMEQVLGQMDAYSNAGDVEGMLSMVWPDGILYRDMVDQLIANPVPLDADVRTTTKLTRIAEWKGDSAIIIFEQHTYRVSGGFYLDNIAVVKSHLMRAKDHSWKFVDMELREPLKYVNTEQALNREADVPDNVKADITAVINKQTQALNEDDVEAYIETLDPNMDGFQFVRNDWQSNSYDWEITNESIRIVGYSGNKAYVYMVRKYAMLDGPPGTKLTNMRAGMVIPVIRTATGQWRTTDGTIVVQEEKLA